MYGLLVGLGMSGWDLSALSVKLVPLPMRHVSEESCMLEPLEHVSTARS